MKKEDVECPACVVQLVRVDAEELRDALEVAMQEGGNYTRKQWKVLTDVSVLLAAYTRGLDLKDWSQAKQDLKD